MQAKHTPVLLAETLQYWLTDKNGIYIDGTFGRGGHSKALLQQLEAKATLLALDRDQAAVVAAKTLIQDDRFCIVHGSFAEIKKIAKEHHVEHEVTGILLDIGVSSPQLDDPERGFSFLHDGPLDMRMDRDQKLDAKTWINQAKEEEMAKVFKEYGEERFARRIANAICLARKEHSITRTKELAEIVAKANPKWEKHKHPATRVFQAIRIFINDELKALETALAQCVEILKPGGRILVISFHSLEDRIVKHFFKEKAQGKPIPKRLPVREVLLEKQLRLVSKAIKPSEMELKINPRARSSVLRVAEKIT